MNFYQEQIATKSLGPAINYYIFLQILGLLSCFFINLLSFSINFEFKMVDYENFMLLVTFSLFVNAFILLNSLFDFSFNFT